MEYRVINFRFKLRCKGDEALRFQFDEIRVIPIGTVILNTF